MLSSFLKETSDPLRMASMSGQLPLPTAHAADTTQFTGPAPLSYSILAALGVQENTQCLDSFTAFGGKSYISYVLQNSTGPY